MAGPRHFKLCIIERCCLLGLQKPLISLGLGDVCRATFFSKAVITEDGQERDMGVYSKTHMPRVRSGRLEYYTIPNWMLNENSVLTVFKNNLM